MEIRKSASIISTALLCATTFLILYRYFNQQNNIIENAEKQITEFVDLKIPGYAPKYALQFKQDLKNREKEDKKKNTNNHKNESSYLDGGEVRTSLNILIIHTRKIHDMV